MKKILLPVTILSLALGQPVLRADLAPDTRPPKSIQIGTEDVLTLPLKTSDAEIVIARDASPSTRYAAQELKAFLEKKLETEIPVSDSPAEGKISFVLGINEFSRAAGIDDSKLCRDSFIIRTDGRRIYILGRDDSTFDIARHLEQINGFQFHHECGTLYGVYDFLERFADVRFYFEGDGTLCKPGGIHIPEVDIFDRPDFEGRRYTNGGLWFDGTRGENHKNIDYRRWKMETEYIPNCHGLSHLGYETRFGESHPEYFAMDSAGRRLNKKSAYPGQFCYSSGVAEEIYQDARSCLLNEPPSKRGVLGLSGTCAWDPSGHKPGKVFGLFSGDAMQQCHCEKCAKYLKDDAAFCEFFWGVLYDIAERIQKEKIPGILTVAAYGRPGHVIPKRPMPSNVELMICPQGPWEIGRKSVYERGKARVKAWAEYAGKKISFWNYPGKYAGQLAGVPHITPNAIGAYYKEMAPWYKGGYVNSASDRYYNNVLNLYIFGKVAWDNQADVRALLDEYYRRMFGPAADTMRKIDERIEDLWLHKVLKEPMNTPLGMLSREATDHEIWTEIYSPREREQFKAQFDLAEKQCASDPDSLKRVRLVRTNLLDPLLKCGEKYDQMAAALARFVLYTDPLEKGETIKVDGILDEPAWKNAKEIGLQKIILPGGKDDPSEKPDRSRVYVTGDAKNLYIAFELAEPKMKEVSAPRRARGDKGIWSDNAFEIFLNPSGDRRNYYQFTLNSSGSFALVKHSYVSGFDLMDANWTPRWSFKIVSGSDRWSGEIAIPRAEIGMTKADSFVANFTRHQKRKDRSMYYSWSPFLVATRTSPFQDVDHYGTVVFGRDPRKNLLLNGDFSQKLRSGVYYVGKWAANPPKDGEMDGDEDVFISAPRSLRLSGESIFKGYFRAQQALPFLKPGGRYRLSFFIRTRGIETGLRTGGGIVNVWDDNNLWFPRIGFTGDTEWTFQQFEFVAGPETNKQRPSVLNLFLLQSKGTVWFDDVCLEEIP